MKTRWTYHLLAVLAVGFPIAAGCATTDGEEDTAEDTGALTKTDYEIDFTAFNRKFASNVSKPEDAFSVLVKLGGQEFRAPTHLFGKSVNVIPYSNDDNDKTATGKPFERGDQVIAKVFKPGDVGIAVKHHRASHPVLDLNGADPKALKEHFKLQDTHIEIVVGVKRDGVNGAITVNNPQTYENGFFGTPDYPMVFMKPVYPSYLSAAQKDAFQANVRTMLLGFNAVTSFPGDYNGGDPLGARNPERVREYVKQMVLAVTGDATAQAWFTQTENLVYCAELAFLSFSAGLIVPLNDATMKPLVGDAAWAKFTQAMKDHNDGKDNPFVKLNKNKRVSLVKDLVKAPESLKPAGEYSKNGVDKDKLALAPMTMSDIVEEFMRTHIPREKFGEALAPAQGALLAAMKPGLLEQMGMDKLAATDPKRVAVEALFDQIVGVVKVPYANYKEFRKALAPYLVQAASVTGPRGDTGVGLFVPPSLFHVAAQGKRPGLLSFQYEGHGVHISHTKKAGKAAAAPTPVAQIAASVSCVGACGSAAPGGCYCDATCATDPTNCCADYRSACP